MASLSLSKANKIIAVAFRQGAELGLKPLAVAVLDAGGHLLAFQRQDGASMMRYEIASGKAYGAIAVGAGSRWLNAQAIERPHFLEGLSNVSGGRIIAVPGGVLVRGRNSEIIGAVGVTGDTSDNDEICAIAAIESAGFQADGG